MNGTLVQPTEQTTWWEEYLFFQVVYLKTARAAIAYKNSYGIYWLLWRVIPIHAFAAVSLHPPHSYSAVVLEPH